MQIEVGNLLVLLPVGVLCATGLLLLMYEVFSEQSERAYAAQLTVLGIGIAMWLTARELTAPAAFAFGPPSTAPLVVDMFARVAMLLVMAGAVVATLLSPAYARNAGHAHGEYYALIVFSVVGMAVMAMSRDLFTFFLGLETMSVAVYALTGLRQNDPRSPEAALKYFLMGAFATGFLLFGITLIYGATGSVSLEALAAAVVHVADFEHSLLLTTGVVLLLVGLAFKVAAVPFHMWAPDTYEGAPTPVSGFMAVGVKAAAFVSLLRIVMLALAGGAVPSVDVATVLATTATSSLAVSPGVAPISGVGVFMVISPDPPVWLPFLSWMAAATIIVGNAMALVQQNVKRMLAYSSVAHAGYALIGVVAAARGVESAGVAVLFYLTVYTFMTLGAFGVLTFLERRDGGFEAERFGAFAGTGYRHPALGAAMVLFMVALAGLPPTGGFFGKLYLFSAALDAGDIDLVLIGVLGSVVSVFYYLQVIVAFYMRETADPGPTPTATGSTQLTLGLTVSAFFVLFLGVFPGRWIEITEAAVRLLASS